MKRSIYRIMKNKKKYHLGFIVLILLLISVYKLRYWLDIQELRDFIPPEYKKKIYPELGCQFPDLNPFSKIAMRFNEDLPKIVCHGEDWVECNMSECKVTQHILDTTRDIVCHYKDIRHISDKLYMVAEPVTLYGDAVYKLNASDGFKVSCTGSNKAWLSILTKRWFGYKAGIRPLQRTPQKSNDSINILIVGFDSTSRNGFIRKMQKSYRYLVEKMKAVILKGFSKMRHLYEGKMEERLAFMSIILPEKLKRQRPDALYFLKNNAAVLTTPFDIHTTLLDAMGLEKYANDFVVPHADMKRGMSLLKSIPISRSCASAGVMPHWCACLGSQWRNVPVNAPIYKTVVNGLVDFINNFTAEKRELCAERELTSIQWVVVNQDMKDLSRKDAVYFQTLILTKPGMASFEASMQYDSDKDRLIITEEEISRISAYGNEPACLSDTYIHLYKYCYCKNKLLSF